MIVNKWIKASFSYGNNCVEVWHSAPCSLGDCVQVATGPDEIKVRDSKNPDGPVLTFTRSEWDAFTAGVIAGEFTP